MPSDGTTLPMLKEHVSCKFGMSIEALMTDTAHLSGTKLLLCPRCRPTHSLIDIWCFKGSPEKELGLFWLVPTPLEPLGQGPLGARSHKG